MLTRWEGVELMNYSPFIFIRADQRRHHRQAHSTARQTTGPGGRGAPAAGPPVRGRVDGGGARHSGRVARLRRRGYLRPNFIQPYRCQNVLIEGVTIVNSPMWEIHPVLCRNVIVRGVTIRSHGPNNDGCDPNRAATC